jgi:Ca2+-binding RTX toxin-like protein
VPEPGRCGGAGLDSLNGGDGNHTINGGGEEMIVAGTHSILLAGMAVVEIGSGLACSGNDFIF